MSCRPYINNLSKNPRVQNELDKLHNSIFNRLIDSKLFNKWEDYHFLPTNQAKYAAAKNLISQINEQYKKKVAGTSFTKASGKEFVFVNVKNFVKEFEEGQSLLEAQQVDEFGDSVPMYNRQPDISKLSDVEKTIYKSSPTEFISYLRDQLYGLSNGIKVYENPPSEKSMVERYGKELIALAKENPMYNRVDYKMKVINNILSNKEKVDKWLNNKSITPPSVFWEKLQKDLQIPRPQVDLLAASEGNTFDEKLANFMANYSYTIEINTARKGVDIYDMPSTPEDPYQSSFNINGRNYIADYQTKEFLYRDELVEFDQPIPEDVYITYDEFKQAEKDYVQSLKERNKGTNSDYHSNLTVPGGTNYTENEIATPLITPSIKGHAQFSTDNGIGWFRSDDKENSRKKRDSDNLKGWYYGTDIWATPQQIPNEYESTKTRRILEVQSDLFQKGRDKNILSAGFTEDYIKKLEEDKDLQGIDNLFGGESTVNKHKKQPFINSQNQFLQLLNKDNNWVTFFVKSIIQDSAKKGYEKVLFPTGNTANKVEGHTTLEEFKKQKEDRIKELEKEKKTLKPFEDVVSSREMFYNRIKVFNLKKSNGFLKDGFAIYTDKVSQMIDKSLVTKDITSNPSGVKFTYINLNKEQKEEFTISVKEQEKRIDNEINQIKQELERIEKEGFGALRPIFKFYEETVGNILKKQGYNPTTITDEYGNTWHSITIEPSHQEEILFSRRDQESKQLSGIALNEIISNLQKKLDVQTQEITEDEAYGLTENTSVPYNGESAFFFEGKIYLVKGKYGLDDKLHEIIHPFIRAVAKQNPELFNNLYKEAVNNPELQDYLEYITKLYPEYAEKAFKGDTVPFMEEFLVHVIQKQATGELNNMKPETKNWLQRVWDNLKNIFRNIFNPKVSLAGLNANMTIEDLTKMLLFSDNNIDLRGKDGLWNYVFPVYNRSFVDEVQRIQKEKLNPQIETFFSLVKSQLERIRSNNNLKELKEILGNDEDGNPLVDARNLLSTSNKLIGDVENDMDKMLTFAEAISSLSVFSEKMITHVDQFIDRDDIGEKYKLGVLLNYGYIVKEWNKVISDFKTLVPYQKTNPLRTEVAKISDIFNEMHHKMQSYAQNTGLVSLLKKDIDTNEYLTKAFEGLKANIEKLQKEYDNGNKSIKSILEKEKELLRITEPTEDNLKKWLAGEMGDSNTFSMMFESYTSNPNPIVGSFINYFYKEKAKLDSEVHETNTSFLNRIVGIFKKSNIDRNKIEDTFDKITDSIQILAFDKDGTPIKREVKVFANQYAGDYQYQVDLYKHKLQEFKEKTPEYYALKKEYEQFKTDYMFDSSSDIVTKARQFWLQSDNHQIAKDLRQSILDIVTAKQQVKPLTEEEREFKDTEVKLLWRRYSRLSSLRNDDNTLKTPDNPNPEMNSTIAQIIKDYQEEFGGLYERVEIKDAFTTAKKVQEEKLKFSGIEETSPEFKKAMSAWMRDNIKISNSPQFYEDRQKILDEMSAILSKLPDSERKSLDIGAVWKEIFDVTKGYRDEDGQPIGSDLTLDQQQTVKDLQDKLDEVSQNFVTKSGLTKEEGERYFELKRLLLENAISKEESNEYNELDLKKKQNRLSESDNDRLEELYIQLSEIQRKIPTNYYIATFNNWMDVVKGSKIDIDFTATSPETIDPLLEKNEEFRKWFMSNHRLVEKYDPDSKKYITSYERIYVWNRIIPNDEDVAELVKNEDYAGLMKLGHKYLSVTPSNDYTFYTLKKEYKTEKAVGVTIDNRGNWLPKPTEKSATPKQKELMTKYGISYAKDAKYQGLIHDQLKNNPSLKGYYDLNETYKQFSLDAQKEAPNYTKLWYEIPRMRKTSVEKFTVENGKEVINNFTDWMKRINPFVKKETDDAYSRGVGNYDATKALIMTDLFGNVPTKIPIKYTNHVELENISKDLGGALLRYNTSIRSNKMLHEINPIAQTLKETLGNPENAIKMQDSMSKNFAKLKYVFVKPKEPNKVVSNMYKAVSNFIEREFEGKEKIFEAGVGFDRFASHIMKLGAVGSLALSPAAAIRNLVSGNIQKTLEGVTGKSFTGKDLKDGEIIFDTQYMPALVKDAYKAGERSLYSQKFELFDPLMHYNEKTGEQANVSMQADLAEGKVFFSMQKLGEIHVQGSTFAVMMQAQKVPFTDPKTGEKSYIPYESAWELKNGVISLREGVDKAWDKYGDNFAQFKLRMQKVNEMLQGAYAKENQAEFQRYTVGALAGFMRKYFVPMFMNRFSGNRINYSLGEFREGYYMTTFKAIGDTLKHGKDNWHTYTPEQRSNVLKVGAEVGYSLLFALMISLLGFDGDDDDKYKKLKANPWIQTYAIYQLMAIKSEVETFIPFWSMGFNEWVRTAKTPTVAFNVISKYMKMTEDLWNWTTGSEDAYYDKAYGVYDKGDVKFLADLYSLIGIKNWMVLDDPTEGVKAYVRMQRRY